MSFSFRQVSWREWSGLAAGLLAFAATFLPWTVLSATNSETAGDLRDAPASDLARNAWNSTFFGWFPPILLLLAGLVVVVFGQLRKVRSSGLPQLWLVAAAVALLLVVLGWLFIELQFDDDQREIFKIAGVAINAGFGRYLGILAALGSLVCAILDTRAARAERLNPRRR
ncbi:hypothetical protein [Amycolatopsis anabasis]|uniref:hypothetical protein n=1 Tax=Amycolatopsis anabasis TaxID=1840409 RepID=UPI00131AEC88|nr:hypothetical protein [Amycolatopsis anabasis]